MTFSPVRLAVSMGDPCGVGPEIIAEALQLVDSNLEVVVHGDPGVMDKAAAILKRQRRIESPRFQGAEVVAVTEFNPADVSFGKPSATSGEAAYKYIISALQSVLDGKADALVTAPIGKRWLMEAGYEWPGHTELLAEKTGADRFAMMLAAPTLRVAPLTIHMPLAWVPDFIEYEHLIETFKLVNESLKKYFGIEAPCIACSGLNPHAGEEGKLGFEEIDIIKPAVKRARKSRLNVTGPLPADTMFSMRGEYDVFVCMYHDQALIPIKTLHPFEAVNITLGLPVIRTSPDHGTAYELAGQAIADPTSMKAAMETAARMFIQSTNSTQVKPLRKY